MDEQKNLIKDHLLKQGVFNPDQHIHSLYYENADWDVYQEADDILLYLSYELTDQGIGYAFFIRIQCGRFKYNIDPFFYAKSFSGCVKDIWENCPQVLQDKFLSDSMHILGIFGR